MQCQIGSEMTYEDHQVQGYEKMAVAAHQGKWKQAA